jgi:hypothetical protein
VTVADDVDAAGLRRTNLYEVLQISTTATPEVIHAAYRALARAHHPDLNPSPEAARQMTQLNAAYGVLSDPVRRARYDALRGRASWPYGEAARVAPTRTASAGSTGRERASAVRRPPINRVTPASRGGGPRQGRALVMLAVVLLLFGALVVYSAWLVAGALDDESVQALTSHPPELQKMIERR